MTSISQITKKFFEDYYSNYKDYNFYVKGFAFGDSNNPSNASDYGTNAEGIKIRKGQYPTWEQVNDHIYQDAFYVGDASKIEGVCLNYTELRDKFHKKHTMVGAIDISDRKFSYANGKFTLSNATEITMAGTISKTTLIISDLDSTENIKVGWRVLGIGIPTFTYVEEILSTNSIRVSNLCYETQSTNITFSNILPRLGRLSSDYKYVLMKLENSTDTRRFNILLATDTEVIIDTTYDSNKGRTEDICLCYFVKDSEDIKYIIKDCVDTTNETYVISSGNLYKDGNLVPNFVGGKKTSGLENNYHVLSTNESGLIIERFFGAYPDGNTVFNFSTTREALTTSAYVGSELMFKNCLPSFQSEYASPQNSLTMRLTIPHQLDKSFSFNELYIYFALYPKTDVWDETNKKYPNEIVDFGYYANISSDADLIEYSPQSLIKYTYDINLRLYYIYQRLNIRKENSLVIFGAPESNDKHAFVAFENNNLNYGTITLTYSNTATTKDFTVVDKVTIYADTNTLEGYIIQGEVSTLTDVYGWHIAGNNITQFKRNIVYTPIEHVENSLDEQKRNLLLGDSLTNEQLALYEKYGFQLYSDVQRLYLYKFISDNLYVSKEMYSFNDRISNGYKDLEEFKTLRRMSNESLYRMIGEIENPETAHYSVISTKTFEFDYREGIDIHDVEVVQGNEMRFFDLSEFATASVDISLLGTNITILNNELSFSLQEIQRDVIPFYLYVTNSAKTAVLTKYEISSKNFVCLYNSDWGYAIGEKSSAHMSFQKLTVNKVLKYYKD